MDETYGRGVDVSHHQGVVDWQAVKAAGIRFAIVKASEGQTLVDGKFQRNWSGARAAGLARGAYHFFRPRVDAENQADRFLTTIETLAVDDLPPVIDVEVADGVSAADILDGIEIWVKSVQVATGRKPMIYTGVNFWKETLGNSTRFADHPLWIAHYTAAPQPRVPGGWTTWSLWQHSETGTIDGVGGPVDLDRINTAIQILTSATVVGA